MPLLPRPRKLKHGTVWYGQVKVNGRWKQFNTHCEKRVEARDVLRRVEAELAAGRDPFRDEGSQVQDPIKRLAESFLDDRAPHWAAGTFDLYRDMTATICELWADWDIRQVGREQIVKYRQFLQKRGSRLAGGLRVGEIATATLNGHLRRLRAFLNWCAESVTDYKPPRVRELPLDREIEHDYFSAAEVEKLLTVAAEVRFNGQPLRDFIALLVCTGMRRNEALELTWNDVDLQQRRITLRATTTKTKRGRVIPVAPILEQILSGMTGAHTGLLFPAFTENVSKSFAEICVRAGIPVRPLHKLRDTFAIHAALSGLAPLFLGKILGHAKLQTTYRYYFEPDAHELSESMNLERNAPFVTAVLRGLGK